MILSAFTRICSIFEYHEQFITLQSRRYQRQNWFLDFFLAKLSISVFRSRRVTIKKLLIITTDRSFHSFKFAHALDRVCSLEFKRRNVAAFNSAVHLLLILFNLASCVWFRSSIVEEEKVNIIKGKLKRMANIHGFNNFRNNRNNQGGYGPQGDD